MAVKPIFTIVTPVWNCAPHLPRHLASIRSQGMLSGTVEHWIIDGGSTDGTVEFLERQPDIKFISEKDRGQYDAVNKGVARATGDWIIWLNGDDELAPGALPAFLEARKQFPEALFFCGDQKVFRYDGTFEKIEKAWNLNLNDLLGTCTSIIQASQFVHRSVWEKVGPLDAALRYAGDYEWTVRAMRCFKCEPLPIVLTHYHRRPGSLMDAHMPEHYQAFLRVRRACQQPYLSLAEFRIRFYLATEPLRRIRWLRRSVRSVKAFFGREPLHPLT